MENEAVDANFFVPRDTDITNEVSLVGDGAESGEKPAVSIETLTDITCGGFVEKEFRVLEDIGHPFDRTGQVLIVFIVIFASSFQAIQAISAVTFQVEFDIEMRISVLGVDPTAFLGDLDHSILALCGSLFV